MKDVDTVKQPRIVTIVLTMIFIFFVGQRLFFFAPTRLDGLASSILYPFLHIEHAITAPCITLYNTLCSAQQMYTEHQILQQKYETMCAELVEYKAVHTFDEQTKELRDFAERYRYRNGQIIQVIGRCITDQEHTIFIDAGSYKSIELDMVVVWKNALVGKVIEVYPYYSKVRLVTDTASKVAVVCSKTGARGICEGTGSLSALALNFVNHFDNLIGEDTVLSNGDGLIFPEGFSLGTVATIQSDGLYYKSSIRPYVDIANIRYIYVVNKNGLTADFISSSTVLDVVIMPTASVL